MLAQFEHLCLITATCHKCLKPSFNISNYGHWNNWKDKELSPFGSQTKSGRFILPKP